MGACLRKPMRDDDRNLLAGAAKPAMNPSFANDDDAVDITGVRPAAGVHENPLAALGKQAYGSSDRGARRRGDEDEDDEDDGDDRAYYNDRRTAATNNSNYGSSGGAAARRGNRDEFDDDDDVDDRRRRRNSYEAEDDDGGGYQRGGRGARAQRHGRDDDDDDDSRYSSRQNGTQRGKTAARGGRHDDDDDDADRLDDRRRGKAGAAGAAVVAAPAQRGGARANPFDNDDGDNGRSVATKGAATKRGTSKHPFDDDDDDDDVADKRSIRTTGTSKTGGKNNADDFASIKTKGQAAVSKRDDQSNFAAEARSLRNQQLSRQSAQNYSDEDDDDDTQSMGPDGKVKPKLTQFGQLKKKLCTIRLVARYNVARGALELHVHEIEGLSERKFGKPNLYLKMYLSPDPKRKTKRKTQVIKGEANPNFDEKFEFKVPPEDILKRSLRLALWEEGVLANSVLGEVSIGFGSYNSIDELAFSDAFAISRRTRNPKPDEPSTTSAISGPEDSDDDAKSVRSVRSTFSTESGAYGSDEDDARSVMSSGSVISVTPKLATTSINKKKLCNIRLAVGYNSLTGTLRVHVQELGEMPWDEDTKPDLYVKMFVAPDPKKETKRKTRVVNASLAPKFDELFEWHVQEATIKEKALIVSLCEEGTLANEIIGEVSLGFSNFTGDFEWNDWFALNRKVGRRMSLKKKRGQTEKDKQAALQAITAAENSDARSVRSSKSGYGDEDDEVIKPQLTDVAAKKKAVCHVKLDISYEAARGTFQIVIHKVKGLNDYPAMDLFMTIWLFPDEKTTRRDTAIIKNTKAPQFDETFEFKYAVGEVQHKSLFMQLWQDLGDKNLNKLMGQVSIGFKSTEGSNFAWSDWYALFETKKKK